MAGKQEHSLVKDKLARILIWATESLAAVTLTYAVCFDAYGSPGYGTDGGYGSPIMDTVSRSRPSLSIAPGPPYYSKGVEMEQIYASACRQNGT